MADTVFQSGEFSNPRLRTASRTRSFFFRTWWIFAFFIFCTSFYLHGGRKRDAALTELFYRLQEMQKEKLIACQKRDELQLRLQSKNDPAWIEMILMRELGVVPEGWVKVHFTR
jgi:hypothetical protein